MTIKIETKRITNDKNSFTLFIFFQLLFFGYYLIIFNKIFSSNLELILLHTIVFFFFLKKTLKLFDRGFNWVITILNCIIFTSIIIKNSSLSRSYIDIIELKNHTVNLTKFNIFFVETNKNRDEISPRQMCAIESAAFHNPEANIYLFSLRAKLNLEFLRKYKNIEFVKTSPEKVYEGTPLAEWWKYEKNKLEKGKFKINDLSDTFRLALVYKYGGLYSDLDIINLKNLRSLRHFNGVCYSKDKASIETNNAILLFEKNHGFLLAAMNDLLKNYKINQWGYNGPLLMGRVLKVYCKTQDIYKDLVFDQNQEYEDLNLTQVYRKCNMVLFHKKFFYPYHWTQADSLFKKNSSIDIESFKNSYAVHFYNKISSSLDLKLNDNSIFEFFVANHCPLTYSSLISGKLKKI